MSQGRPLTEHDDAQLLSLLTSGKSPGQIAKELNLSRSQVSHRVKRPNVQRWLADIRDNALAIVNARSEEMVLKALDWVIEAGDMGDAHAKINAARLVFSLCLPSSTDVKDEAKNRPTVRDEVVSTLLDIKARKNAGMKGITH